MSMARNRRYWPGVLGLLLLSVIGGGALVLMNSRVPRSGTPAKVTIPNGATLGEAADSLRSARVIRSSTVFQLVALLTGGGDGEIRYGRYFIARGASTTSILAQLHSGAGRFHRLTVPEGWGIRQIARLLQDSLGIASDSTLAATRDSSRRARMHTPAADVEGYLFPATYDFTDGTRADAVVDSMLLTFDRRWKTSWDSTLRAQGRTRHAAVTLASIVEKEAVRSSERPLIAAVYTNRLRKGVRLQADPTVLYALGLVAKRVLFTDLRVESPYNTYRVSGLPPGPIASPGTASIVAAIQPAASEAMFFVAFPDGHSQFTNTFAEHSTAVKSAHAARDSAARR
jgi:UPF0755 protein